ncbi:putative phage tail sheath protein [Bradyrhizobium sp. ORS 278]|uniref:phage tail sheath family protein n=1 Tax=Bradyrhizobium sp. (strain ORS 278) TaxID=114615 RepID=UPI0001508260|nr:phage tail sheath C-terminal domain-containing protein [Bradyrhizobium sp. ORS 278]CAL78134.1 putative phage tail sheath protein [Bradyrhizobium sp. ORS 278]
MPVQVSYPGVYVQEIPSGVRTITGVATSVTAFIGRTLYGPDNEPVLINSYGDFERIFGGLWGASSLGYAVRDFFLNGGGQAIVVRLYNEDTTANARPARSKMNVGTFRLEASDKGTWGAGLRASIDTAVSADVAARLGLTPQDLFNLTVTEVDASERVVAREVFRNLTVKDGPQRIDNVLRAQSKLVRWSGAWPPNPLPTIAAADDDVTKALKQLAAANAANPPVPNDINTAQQAVTTAKAAMAANDGLPLTLKDNFNPAQAQAQKRGLYALEKADLINLLCIPPYTASNDVETGLISLAAAYCEQRRAMLLVDPPSNWVDVATAQAKFTDTGNDFVGTRSRNAALFFPRLRIPDPLLNNQVGEFVPCGAVAGVFARTDATRGIWKAPAGLDAGLNGVPQLRMVLTDAENGQLNQLGINCLRSFPAAGRVVWGARTLRGADQLADEYKYIPVRRTALYIEESLYRGLQWVVFEPNDEPLWAQIRLNVGAFMHTMFRQGAFQGSSPRDAYFVKCDGEVTTDDDVNRGVVNVLVGFAPLKPAEFVIISIQQMAGQIAT